MSDENHFDESQSHSATHNFLNPSLNYLGTKTRGRFSGSCLKQDKITYTQRKIAKIYIVYEINKKDRKNTESINPRVSKPNNGKTMILSKCEICGSK